MRVTVKIFTILFVCCLVAPISVFAEESEAFTADAVIKLMEAAVAAACGDNMQESFGGYKCCKCGDRYSFAFPNCTALGGDCKLTDEWRCSRRNEEAIEFPPPLTRDKRK